MKKTLNKIIENFFSSINEKSLSPLVVLLGPTASGKTALSLEIAQKFNCEIISADSRQIYKEMNISTDKIQEKDRKNIKHHLINLIPPDREFSLADYKKEALKIIKEIYKKGKTPLIVGGTGLYIDAVCKNFSTNNIKPDWRLRAKLKEQYDKKGAEYLYEKLKVLDPSAAQNIDPRNHRYLIRALEINLKGKNKEDKKGKPLFTVLKLGISRPREELYERINKRVDKQVKDGLIEEVEKLVKRYAPETPSMTSLGIKQIIPYLKKEQSIKDCVEILKKETRHYAKRQMTWFRRDKDIIWIDV